MTLDAGSGGATVATDEVTVSGQAAAAQVQYVKIVDGTSNGTEPIQVAGGTEANALRVTIANDSTGLVSVDDNGGALTVDNGGTFATQATLQAGTAEVGKLAAGVAEIGNVKNSGTFVVQEDGAALTSLQIIDDWDESDRAKVNPIVGQAGVAAGAGAVGVTVPRVTLASNDPAVALLTTIDSDTNTIQTDTTTIAGAVSGTEMQVDVVAALPAGTNAIGKLAANSGVDIGDVDVTSITLPRSQIGPGEPGTAVDSYTHVAINLTTAANQVLVSSAPSKQIWVYGYAFTCGTADGQTVSLQDEDDAALTGIMAFAQYGGVSVPPSGNFSMPIFKLGTDKDLEIDITGGDVDGYVAYSIMSV